jgi:hypothetical protein
MLRCGVGAKPLSLADNFNLHKQRIITKLEIAAFLNG